MPRIEPYDDAIDNGGKFFTHEKMFVDEPCNKFEPLKDDNLEIDMKNR